MAETLKLYAQALTGPKTVNLTAKGLLAWATWGYSGHTPTTERNDMVSPLVTISALTVTNGTLAYGANPAGVPGYPNWSNGTPTVSSAGKYGYVQVNPSAINNGGYVDIGVTNSLRCIKVLTGALDAAVTLTATLSGGAQSSANTTMTALKSNGRYLITIFVEASGTGQTLRLTWNNPSATGKMMLQTIWVYGAKKVAGFIDFKDDGDESHSTQNAAQNTNPSLNVGVNHRPRFKISAPAAEASPAETLYAIDRTSAESDSDYEKSETSLSGYKKPVVVAVKKIPDDTAMQTYTSQNGQIVMTKAALDALGIAQNDWVFIVENYYKTASTTIATDGTYDGGQSWTESSVQYNSGSAVATKAVNAKIIHCKFDGTWDDKGSGNSLKLTPDSGGTQAFSAYLVAIRNQDQSTPLDVAIALSTVDPSSGKFTIAGPTTNTPNALAVVAICTSDDNQFEGVAGELTYQEFDKAWGCNNSGTGNNGIQVYYKEMPTPGAAGNLITYQLVSSGDGGVAITFAVKPAAKTNETAIAPSAYITDGEATTARMA